MLIEFQEIVNKYKVVPKGILHIGANFAEESPSYMAFGIGKTIWIESDYSAFEKLKEITSKYPLYKSYYFIASNIDIKEDNTKKIDTLFEEEELKHYDYDFLNLNINESELLALKGMENVLKVIECAYISFNSSISEIDEYLSKYGFKRLETKIIKDGCGEAFYIKRNDD